MKLTVSWGLPCTDVPHTDLSNSGDVDCPFTDKVANCATASAASSW